MRTLAPRTLTRSELLAECVRAGLAPSAAAALVDAAEDRRIVEWIGMSAEGEPLYRLRTTIALISPGGR